MSIQDSLIKLSEQLYPKGRAFRMKGNTKTLHTALAISEETAYNDAIGVLDGILPDNDNFTEDDATAWETRLGLITNSLVSLADRKLAIKRKMNYPGTILARQNYRYLEGQLQAAGFNVYVYENKWDDSGTYVTQSPDEVTGGSSGYIEFQHGDFQHGDQQHGSYYGDIVANSITSEGDANFDIGDNYRSTFYIGGNVPANLGDIGTFATVDANREMEFRELILKIKPVQTVALLLVNYV